LGIELTTLIEQVEMHHGVNQPTAIVALATRGLAHYIARLVEDGKELLKIIARHR
jgi:hypothetical protein